MKQFILSSLFTIFVLCNPLNADTINCNGLTRTYTIHIPKYYNKNKTVALLIALHGAGGNGKQMERFTRFDPIADRDTAIVIYPDGLYKHWNDGRNAADIKSQQEHVDDIGFISALINKIENDYNINKKKIYVTGISNGGMMCYALTCTLSEKISAIATVVSTIPANVYQNCKPTKPIPLPIMNGVDDPLIPWNGGELIMRGKNHGEIISTDSTVSFWVKNNKCSSTPSEVIKKDDDPKDATSVIIYHYSSSTNLSADVILYKIFGGGHTWPGGSQYLPKFIIGNVSGEFDASETIWKFFKEQ
jgi:polyhydroxybutyrate depolymerase